MSLLRPFRALMPARGCAQAVAAPPYDVLTRAEAKARAAASRQSFLHVSRPEIDLPEATAADAPEVYARAAENMAWLRARGVIARAEMPSLYVYRATCGDHSQTGVAGAVSVADYRAGLVRRHEQTRPDKVADRARQIEAVGAHTGPVMLAHRGDPTLARAVAAIAAGEPALSASLDGVDHDVWLPSAAQAASLGGAAGRLSALYIADGHHRCEAAALPTAAGRGGQARFLGIAFPENALRILGYHRLVRDLNGRRPEDLPGALAACYDIARSATPVRPDRRHLFGMYVAGRWHRLALRIAPAEDADPAARLDVTILSRTILAPILGLGDPRHDDRIAFVGGRAGLRTLADRVDSGEMAVGFALYPTALADLFAVADAGGVMPPKSTWFDPKLADGLLSLPLN